MERASSQHLYPPQGLTALAALVLITGTLAAGYQTTLTPVTLVLNDQVQQLYTQQDTVGALLLDIGLTLHPQDIVVPAPDTEIDPGLIVNVQQVHPVRITADGREVVLHTHATSVEAALVEAGITLEPHDEVESEGEFLAGNPATGRLGEPVELSGQRPEPVHITVRRAVPFTLHENDQAIPLYTTAATIGEALHRTGLTLYLADHVQPGLGERISAGMHVYVARSIPVAVQVDGRTIRTRTHRERVGEVLADLNIVLTGQDYTTPTPDSALGKENTIRIVRVTERFLIAQEPIPFETVWQPAPELEIDHEGLLQEGAPGVRERRIRVRYEDGHEITRTVEDEYVAVPPTTKIRGYGTKIVVRTLDTPSGPVEYWRTIGMLATSYSAATSGTPRSSPWYGRTRTGMQMRKGIVAVDPNVIDLRSRVYVPGYGIGIAGDTGGAIKGKRIDLGYDDDNLVLWWRWVNVYLLTPVPPAYQINYRLGP
jgi:resuscitation-promoting factor RpfB